MSSLEPVREITYSLGKKNITISLDKLTNDQYNELELTTICRTLGIRCANEDRKTRLIDFYNREYTKQFGTTEERQAILICELEQELLIRKMQYKKTMDEYRAMFDKNEKLMEENERLVRLLHEKEDMLYKMEHKLYRSCSESEGVFVNRQRQQGDVETDLSGEEFLTVILSLTVYNKRRLNYIVTLAKGLNSDHPDEEGYKQGAQLYAERCDTRIDWDNYEEDSEEEDEEPDEKDQKRLLKWLNNENPLVYDQIIGRSFDSLPIREQVENANPIVNRYDAEEDYFIGNFFEFVVEKNWYSSMKSLIENIIPMISKCMRFYITADGDSYFVVKTREDRKFIVKSDIYIKRYGDSCEVKYTSEDDTEKTLKILNWALKLRVLKCPETDYIETTGESLTEPIVVSREMGHRWNLTIDKRDIKIENSEIIVHTEVVYNAFLKINPSVRIDLKAFSRDILAKSKGFHKLEKRSFINCIRAMSYRIDSMLYDTVMVKLEDETTILLRELL